VSRLLLRTARDENKFDSDLVSSRPHARVELALVTI
jgi:hypothetical protein